VRAAYIGVYLSVVGIFVCVFYSLRIAARTSSMDKLTKGEQDNIRKMSDARLVSSLVRCGVSLDEVEHMVRNSMINKWAELVAAKADKPPDSNRRSRRL
jgi:hypothetical protein